MISIVARPSSVFAFVVLGLLVDGCVTGHRAGSADLSPPPGPRVELLVREGCPMSGDLEQRLSAALEAGSVGFDVLDQAALSPNDPRRGYPTPTILVDGADLFDLPQPTPPFPEPS